MIINRDYPKHIEAIVVFNGAHVSSGWAVDFTLDVPGDIDHGIDMFLCKHVL